jgi:hypothetical protein
MVMLKDNHIWATGSITQAVQTAKRGAGFALKTTIPYYDLSSIIVEIMNDTTHHVNGIVVISYSQGISMNQSSMLSNHDDDLVHLNSYILKIDSFITKDCSALHRSRLLGERRIDTKQINRDKSLSVVGGIVADSRIIKFLLFMVE